METFSSVVTSWWASRLFQRAEYDFGSWRSERRRQSTRMGLERFVAQGEHYATHELKETDTMKRRSGGDLVIAGKSGGAMVSALV